MSEDLFYNRDRNIEGITAPTHLADLDLTPVYGSQASFTAKNHAYDTDDFYFNMIPLSINSLSATFDLGYSLSETNAQKLANFFESKSGSLPMEFNVDNSGIYRKVSGVCPSYNVDFVNNQNVRVGGQLACNTAPTLMNWSGQTFTNATGSDWEGGKAYGKYDIVYTGVSSNKLNNFYYCATGHTSSAANSPTGASTVWSQAFFFEPDVQQNMSVELKSDTLEYKNSFVQRFNTNTNIATFGVEYKFTDINDHQLKAMLHFLENKGGYRRFRHQIPALYNRPKVYFCPQWTHTWKYYNSNDLRVSFMEDPLGVIPTGT
jgi:phage-related protein